MLPGAPGLVGLLLLLAVGPNVLRAQGLEVGLRAGSSFSTFRGNTEVFRRDNTYDLRWRTGVQVAGLVAVPLNEVLRLRPELRYAQKGAVVEGTRAFRPEGTDGPPELRETYDLSHLQLPVLLEARLPIGGRIQASVLLGPSVALTLGTDFSPDPSSQTEPVPESAVRDVAFSVASGLELGHPLGTDGRLVLGTHYDLGLSTLTEDGRTVVEQGKEADVRNDVFAVSLGYTRSF